MPSRRVAGALQVMYGSERERRGMASETGKPQRENESQTNPVTAIRSVLQLRPVFGVTYSTGSISFSCDGRDLVHVCQRARRGCAKYRESSRPVQELTRARTRTTIGSDTHLARSLAQR